MVAEQMVAEQPAAEAEAAKASEEVTSPSIEINSCTKDELRSLPGVDEVLVQRILASRPYADMEEVLDVVQGAEVSAAALSKLCWVKPSKLAVIGNLLQCWENTQLRVPGSPGNVKRAWFGDPEYAWRDEHGMMCTEAIKKRMRANQAVVASGACLGCDPAGGVWKQLRVEVVTPGPTVVEEPCFPRIFEAPNSVPSCPRWLAFIRHAQAGHNVDQSLVDNPDNALTADGVAQAIQARSSLAGEAVRAADLIVTSPLTRAMQTTGLLLGDHKGARVMVDALGTERYSAPCDQGTAKSELLRPERPEPDGLAGDFRDWEGWEQLPELWWPEKGEDQWERAEAFRALARQRPEDRIVFVGHGAFWDTVLGQYLGNCQVVFCDRSLL